MKFSALFLKNASYLLYARSWFSFQMKLRWLNDMQRIIIMLESPVRSKAQKEEITNHLHVQKLQ